MIACALLLASLGAPPAPPPDLKAWVDYARALQHEHEDGCPPDQPCAQLSRVEVAGQAHKGEVTLTFTGSNLGARPQEVFLVGPASVVSAHAPRFAQGRGSVQLKEKGWTAQVQPGAFALSLVAQFDPAPSVDLELGDAVAHLVDRLSSGHLVYDESSAQHGGTVSLQSEAEEGADKEPVSTRVSRAVRYGSVVTFTYHFAVSGLHEQTRIDLPMLGDEGVESVEPALPYTAGKDSLSVTLTPASAQVTVTGHFNQVPAELRKPSAEPYETWVLTSDVRHPVQWRCDGIEIDGSEVKDLPVPPDGRVFLLQGAQTLRMEPVPVNVDPGRQGAGTLDLSFEQGASDAWMVTLQLAFTTAPNTDRLLVPTPQPAHYAERGGAAVRLYGTDANLSLRVQDTQPIRVQWRDKLATNPVFAWLRLSVPGQHVTLDEVNGKVALQPGYVPLAVLGAEHADGDLLEGVQLYGVLIGLLGVALAQAARFPRWATAILAVLLVGLWAVDDFPREMILTLLAGVAVIARLPTPILEGLRQRRRIHRVLTVVWVLMGLGTLAPCLQYSSARLLAAIHPWSAAQQSSYYGEPARMNMMLEKAAPESPAPSMAAAPGGGSGVGGLEADEDGAAELQKPKGKRRQLSKLDSLAQSESRRGNYLLGKVAKSDRDDKPSAIAEKSVRPVPFASAQLPRTQLAYSLGALLPGQPGEASVLLVGPLLRGLWMLAEACGIVVVLGLLALRSRRLWQPEVVR